MRSTEEIVASLKAGYSERNATAAKKIALTAPREEVQQLTLAEQIVLAGRIRRGEIAEPAPLDATAKAILHSAARARGETV